MFIKENMTGTFSIIPFGVLHKEVLGFWLVKGTGRVFSCLASFPINKCNIDSWEVSYELLGKQGCFPLLFGGTLVFGILCGLWYWKMLLLRRVDS